MNCTECSYRKWLKTSTIKPNEDGVKVRVWKCGRCGHLQNGYAPFHREQPKELYFDIETSYLQVAVPELKVRSQYISPEAILSPSFVICWSAGWIGEKRIYTAAVTPAQAKACDDSKVIKPLWDLLNEADVVIGHNADRFDIKKVNYRFLLHGLEPPEAYKTTDTLKVARKYFAAESNKMDYLSMRLGGLRKHKMDLGDWLDCMRGDKKAIDKMQRYNKGDVAEGKGIYEKMIAWIPVHTGQTLAKSALA